MLDSVEIAREFGSDVSLWLPDGSITRARKQRERIEWLEGGARPHHSAAGAESTLVGRVQAV